MAFSWLTLWELALPLAVILSTAVTVFILTLPTAYSHFHPHEVKDSDFTDDDRNNPEKSGYAYFQLKKSKDGVLEVASSVQVIVLGDIGRSPRMQYHALSIARHGGYVDLIGYVETDVHPDLKAHRFINIIPLVPSPFQTTNKLLFLLYGPLKVLWQFQALYHALGYRSKSRKYMLVQNPPSIPTLAVAGIVAFFRNTRLVIDWHNFGYTILALRLGPTHPFVRLSEWYEGMFAKAATAHFAVTNAMCRVLKQKWDVDALPLHDRPAEHFQPLSTEQRMEFLKTRPELKDQDFTLENRSWRLIVSSTSWTPDEDFSILLEALVQYAEARKQRSELPRMWAVITGKGPQQAYYKNQIQQLIHEGKLDETIISTAFLPIQDYARLLGSADVGISLHTSSSGVDLPMKVVDMFGTGLPVAGKKFEAWPELVKEGENGMGFDTAKDLASLLQQLFGSDGRLIKQIKGGALRECERRWEDEWIPVAGELFRLK
ncbi:Myb, DNA-binding protein [Teratosphaeria nubilosa]|uniref:Chitobiosyldiphosphodolichol beta-mannosyltransferase n=1 Tax=Teratosphaeria nubilosa TaxID=161662 RepID=A0A6G1LI10_9PEZI|nr:Myb, DNA-binding protein [Teratosphaeria nubilosa]